MHLSYNVQRFEPSKRYPSPFLGNSGSAPVRKLCSTAVEPFQNQGYGAEGEWLEPKGPLTVWKPDLEGPSFGLNVIFREVTFIFV